MRSSIRTLMLMAGAVSMLTACSQDLAVTNPNQADIGRALARPSDLENLLAGGFNQYFSSTVGGTTNENANNSFQVLAHENYSGLANFNMGPRAAMPRNPIQNFQGNAGSASVVNSFNGLVRLTRSATLALEKISVATLGSPAQDLRARAYGQFVLGVAHGALAQSYDSATVVVPGADSVPPLVGYDSLARTALRLLDAAIADANNPAAAAAFPIPAGWLNLTSGTVTAANFVRIVRSHKARIRATVARNPAERAAVDWAAVLADAQAGITGDLNLAHNPATGWQQVWYIQHHVGTNWHVMTPFIIGMADTTDAYGTWLNQPLLSRTPFLIRTPDKRFPAGNDRAAQNASSNGGATGVVNPPGVYFRNRRQADDGAASDGTWGFSFYDFVRFQSYFNAVRIGEYPYMTIAEMNALIAEAAIRTGNFTLAASAIDVSRVARGGLPALTGAGITSLTQEVPGGAACVPRVPVRTGNTFTTKCGNILEAMKWEKRMENAYINFGAWYFDSRGWGDLAEGTTIHFPVPWQEQQVRFQSPTTVGGQGSVTGAARGTYGF
ncbi:MAG TPA: hypothetical protein VE861_00505 [Gemmatimonadaceae bacterium]|nr:hypothetical protein [Gemmatimonadaceae bacterium]